MIEPEEFVRRFQELVSSGVGPALPRRRRDRHVLLKAVALGLERGRRYSERELGEALLTWLAAAGGRVDLDAVSLRRELVDAGFLRRDPAGRAYETGEGSLEEFAPGVERLDPFVMLSQVRLRVSRRPVPAAPPPADALAFYAAQSPMTSPGPHAPLFDTLPRGPAALARVVQGLLIHAFWTDRYGVAIPETRHDELQLRATEAKLARILELDSRPLFEAREPGRRLVGNCRDFSLLLTAVLRHQGMSARPRCGFARYFQTVKFMDHWVCEVWDAERGRWVLVDAQLDALQCEALGIRFDPLDVPRDQFIPAGRAWEMCRAGAADPETFGIGELHGLWFVRGDLVRDVASLNRMELLPWDAWGIMEAGDEELTLEDMAALDHVAGLTRDDVPLLTDLREIFRTDPRWRVPRRIRSYTPRGVIQVTLPLTGGSGSIAG